MASSGSGTFVRYCSYADCFNPAGRAVSVSAAGSVFLTGWFYVLQVEPEGISQVKVYRAVRSDNFGF